MALIIDTGPLFAALDRDDDFHVPCRDLVSQFAGELLVPAPVLVEVDYWIHTRLDANAGARFLEDVASGALQVVDLIDIDYSRVVEICRQYADADIGFVDAAVLAIVERLGEAKLATLDRRHFGMLRPAHVSHLQLLP